MSNLPRLGPCGCRRGIERDNCPSCEGTGQLIDWRAFHATNPTQWRIRTVTSTGLTRYWSERFGWVYPGAEDVYTEQQAASIRLPLGGEWESRK